MTNRTKERLRALVIFLGIAVLLFAASGCSTTVYRNGKPALKTYADATNIKLGADGSFSADRLNHSTPTRAAGSVVGTAAAGALPIVTAVARGGL
jgi:hypothetical protein